MVDMCCCGFDSLHVLRLGLFKNIIRGEEEREREREREREERESMETMGEHRGLQG